MISVRSRARTRRLLLIGLMVSLMVHLLGGSLYGLLSRVAVKVLPQWASLQTPPLPKSDVIRLEKALPTAAPQAAPKVVVKPAAPPPPSVKVEPVVIQAPVQSKHEIARNVAHAPAQAAPSKGVGQSHVHIFQPAVSPRTPSRPFYSDDQVAKMNGAFEKAIADSHQTPQQANAAMATAPVMTTVHMQMQVAGIHEGMNPGDGIITVIGRPQKIGDTMWYYTHYEYMYGDGHVEEDDIPWPFHYGPGERDPFAHPYPDHRVALQAPPPGYQPTRPLKPQLMQFFGGPEVR
jgi:hypothetical protein